MREKAVVALLVVVAVLVGPAASALPTLPTRSETSTSTFRGQVTKLIVDSDAGNVVVNPGRPASVRRTERWVYDRPQIRTTFSGGVLSIRSRCSNAPLNGCSTDFTITVTPTAVVEVFTNNGPVRVSGITSSLVRATTDNGAISFTDIAADTVKAQTANGNVVARLTRAPAETRLRTANGDLTADVPRGVYTLDISATSGSVRVTGVQNRPNSGHMLSARSSNGNVRVAGR